jgi:hypothetical protein
MTRNKAVLFLVSCLQKLFLRLESRTLHIDDYRLIICILHAMMLLRRFRGGWKMAQQHNQPYDSSLKALFREQTADH